MSQPLRNSRGVIVGACDSGIPMFDRLGRRPWRPRSRPAAADAHVEVEPLRTVDLATIIRGYTRLR